MAVRIECTGEVPGLRSVATASGTPALRSAVTGETLGVLRLGDVIAQRYGAPYATVHRADLHGLLLQAVRQAGVVLKLNHNLTAFTQNLEAVTLQSGDGPLVEGEVLVGADGLWSPVRQWLLGDGPPRATGHTAYRALLSQSDLPEALRSSQVTAWLGPKLHVVQYPVCGGKSLNVVGIVEGRGGDDLDNWDQGTDGAGLHAALTGSCAPLQDLVRAIPAWRLWALCDAHAGRLSARAGPCRPARRRRPPHAALSGPGRRHGH